MDTLEKIWPQWKVEGLIGKGSYGKVYRMRRSEMGTVAYAALKIIELPQDSAEVRELANSGMDERSIQFYYDDLMKKLQNEIRVMETLKSGNNIVSIEDYAFWKKEVGWKLYIRMELLSNLDTYLEQRGGELSVNEVIKLGMDICTALECCEQAQIIHRDIKPDNVFRSPYGDYKLGDFGIARQIEISRTRYSQRGTMKYMAPEVYYGMRYNKLVDIYSLGIMLYGLLNHGRLPFMPPAPWQIRASDVETAVQRRLSGEKFPEPSMAPGYLGKVILKACAYDMEERYQSAAEFKEALQKGMPSGYTAPHTLLKRTDSARQSIGNHESSEKKSRKYSKAILGTAAVLAAGFAFMLVVRGLFMERENGSWKAAFETEANDGNAADSETTWTWKLRPQIEADDIRYVRSSEFQNYSFNENQKQMMSEYAVIEKDGFQGLISMDGELKADIVYGGIYSDVFHEYTLAELDESGSGEWNWYGLHNDRLLSIVPGETEFADSYYYYSGSLHNTGENSASDGEKKAGKTQEPDKILPVQCTEKLLSEKAGWPVGGDSSYAIYAHGDLVTDFIYDECGSESNGLCAVEKDGKWGYVNDKGDTVIPIKYDASWAEYLMLPGSKSGYREYCYAFSEGYVPLCRNNAWELRDTNGNVVIPSGEFEAICPVYEGCCWVKEDGKWGVISLEESALENEPEKE